MQIDGKRIVLTGAASGIGAALLDKLSSYNCKILAVDVNHIHIPSGKADIRLYLCDLGEHVAVDALFDYAMGHFGQIDIFIANAGFAYYEKIEHADWQHIENIFALNVFSPMYCLAKMIERQKSQPFQFVITASAMSFLGIPGYAYYSGTKAAIHQFTETVRYELPQNVQLMTIYPISTRTSFFQQPNRAKAPIPFPSQTADYVAARIIAGIERNKKYVKPSPGFNLFWTVSRILPIAGLYQMYGNILFKRWLKRQNQR